MNNLLKALIGSSGPTFEKYPATKKKTANGIEKQNL